MRVLDQSLTLAHLRWISCERPIPIGMGDLWPSVNSAHHAYTCPYRWTQIQADARITDSIPLHCGVACNHLHQPGDRRLRIHGGECDHER